MKTCTKCREEKPLRGYSKNRGSDGSVGLLEKGWMVNIPAITEYLEVYR